MHPRHQIRLGRFHQDVVMIRHQNKGVHPPAGPLARLSQSAEETFPVAVIAKDRFLAISAVKEMISGAGELDAGFSGS